MFEWQLTCGSGSSYGDTVVCRRCGATIRYRWAPGLPNKQLVCPSCGAVIYSSPTTGRYAGWGFLILGCQNCDTPPGSGGDNTDQEPPPSRRDEDTGRITPPPYPGVIRSGLRQLLDFCYSHPYELVQKYRWPKAFGLWFRHVNGRAYVLYESNIPSSWTLLEYANYVISVASSPYVTQMGQIGEFLGLPRKRHWLYRHPIVTSSPATFKQYAYKPPVETPEESPGQRDEGEKEDRQATGAVTPPPYPSVLKPGLVQLLNRCYRYPNHLVGRWKGLAAFGLWYVHANGYTYKLPESKIPSHWTLLEYANYVISVASSPYVTEMGQIGEFLGIPWFWRRSIEAISPDDFKQRAYQPPETIEPTPENGDSGDTEGDTGDVTDGSVPPTNGTIPPTDGTAPPIDGTTTPGVPPPYHPAPQPVAWEKVALYGGLALVGLGVLLLIARRK